MAIWNIYLKFLINFFQRPIIISFFFIVAFIYNIYIDNQKHKIREVESERLQKQAIEDVRDLSPSIHLDYLECYAFFPREKEECLRLLADRYIEPGLRENKYYVKQFGYEAEKLGFVAFLQNHGFACEEIQRAPEYISAVGAYKAICSNNIFYLIQFDRENRIWHLLNGKVQE